MLVEPEFLREQEADEADSKNIRTYNDRQSFMLNLCNISVFFNLLFEAEPFLGTKKPSLRKG